MKKKIYDEYKSFSNILSVHYFCFIGETAPFFCELKLTIFFQRKCSFKMITFVLETQDLTEMKGRHLISIYEK